MHVIEIVYVPACVYLSACVIMCAHLCGFGRQMYVCKRLWACVCLCDPPV
jgi:hypothetical protein